MTSPRDHKRIICTRYTEQGAYFDGIDQPGLRLEGTTEMLDNLTGYLR